ncbi:class I SAM-dependent methyltransferase [Roseococcus sp.]|uniref:class I SAM-dependent methyltransferase n=1 Tax=Roseococcus sp. TaxID=2109646 RepID=UPI003BAC9D99
MAKVKSRKWFYEFELPDGTRTETDIPAAVHVIHTARRNKLRDVIAQEVPGAAGLTALDFASHEGYFAVELARHFREVRGIELRQDSLDAAALVTGALGVGNVTYQQGNVLDLKPTVDQSADFVLVYGLLYHLEEPIRALRMASKLSRRHILIETQIFPFDISGRIEDGSYEWQREVTGMFSLSVDYDRREGGDTELAVVPSLNALLFLLKHFGFTRTRVIESGPGDYEQFRRGARVVIYGEKAD